MRHAAVLIAMVAISACGHDPARPPDFALLTEQYRFACDQWAPREPFVQRTLFDLRLRQEGSSLQPDTALVGRIEAAGGRVVHRHHGPMIRAELEVKAVPGLAGRLQGPVNSAASVAEPGAHQVWLIVTLDHAPSADDLSAVVALGGRVTHVYDSVLLGYATVIDDARVPDVRALSRVKRVSFSSVGCVG